MKGGKRRRREVLEGTKMKEWKGKKKITLTGTNTS